MKTKLLGKKESIFILLLLAIVCILCFTQFLISLVSISDCVNMYKLSTNIPNSYFKEFNVIKVVSILTMCFTMLSFLLSLLILLIRKIEIRRAFLISIFTILFLSVVFFFIIKFTAGEEYSILYDYASGGISEGKYMIFSIENDFIQRNIYLLFSMVLVLIMSFISFYLSNILYSNEETDKSKNQEENFVKTTAEQELENEIEKMKTRLRIKDLEKEYLNLKTKLDE